MLLRFSPWRLKSPTILSVSTFALRSPDASASPPFCRRLSISPIASITRNITISASIIRKSIPPCQYPSYPMNRFAASIIAVNTESFHCTPMLPIAFTACFASIFTGLAIADAAGPSIFLMILPQRCSAHAQNFQHNVFFHHFPSLKRTEHDMQKTMPIPVLITAAISIMMISG